MLIAKGDKVKVSGHVFARGSSGQFHLITNMSGTVQETGDSELALVLLRGTRRRHQIIPFHNLEKVG